MAQCVATTAAGTQCLLRSQATRTRLCAQHLAKMGRREKVINAKTNRALGVRPIPKELSEPFTDGDARRAAELPSSCKTLASSSAIPG